MKIVSNGVEVVLTTSDSGANLTPITEEQLDTLFASVSD